MSGINGRARTALVTGCSSGLGLEFARLLLGRGLKVWGLSRRRGPLEVSEHFRWIGCDLANAAALRLALEKVFGESGGIDLLVNNAGFGCVGSLAEHSLAEIEANFRVMLLAPIMTTRFFLNQDLAPAVVVNVSSLARELPIPLMPVYNSAKAGLSAFTLSMALDRDAYPKTRFIDFCPGDYNTPFSDSFASAAMSGEEEAAVRSAYLSRLANHHKRAPGPERAAADLWRAIERGKTGTVRSGAFFQAVIAPLGVRLLPGAWLRAAIRRYYGLTK
jgi:NAD(P)-dependent dehydrogenase (short-subunit alcohol dehydrogenase family)